MVAREKAWSLKDLTLLMLARRRTDLVHRSADRQALNQDNHSRELLR